jgi:serine/threonine protein kinase
VNVCQAIGHAHSRKVIHRDLKPENVAIDSFGQVIVIDWGIAMTIDDSHVGDSYADFELDSAARQETLQGQVLGTPLYMAPEQAAGRIDELDERTDIYGLGAILFAILTGTAPHEKTKDEAQTSGGRELLTAISSLPTPNAREVDRRVEISLAAICEKAMARKQYARYQSAAELADDVQRWMAGEPVAAHRENLMQRIARWIQHHRTLSQIMAVILIAAMVALATIAATVRQSGVAAKKAVFEQLHAYDKEIQVQLESEAVSLMQDARFMSTLPPIQGIIDSRNGNSDSGDDESVWRERLETIYTGALRANPSYLSISYSAVAEDEALNIVRVERSASDINLVRRAHARRLTAVDAKELVASVASLSQGDVLLMIRQKADSEKIARREVHLIAATPVFDERTGELFGIVTVETDLLALLVQFLDRIAQNTANILVTDDSGTIWVNDDPRAGIKIESREVSVSTDIPAAAEFFQTGEGKRFVNENEGWIANRIPLDPANPHASIGVILQLRDER